MVHCICHFMAQEIFHLPDMGVLPQNVSYLGNMYMCRNSLWAGLESMVQVLWVAIPQKQWRQQTGNGMNGSQLLRAKYTTVRVKTWDVLTLKAFVSRGDHSWQTWLPVWLSWLVHGVHSAQCKDIHDGHLGGRVQIEQMAVSWMDGSFMQFVTMWHFVPHYMGYIYTIILLFHCCSQFVAKSTRIH